MAMRRALEDFKISTKDVDSKLDMLEWKLETVSQNYTGNVEDIGKDHIDILKFLKNIRNLKQEYAIIKPELKTIIDMQENTMDQLHERMGVVRGKFDKMAVIIKQNE